MSYQIVSILGGRATEPARCKGPGTSGSTADYSISYLIEYSGDNRMAVLLDRSEKVCLLWSLCVGEARDSGGYSAICSTGYNEARGNKVKQYGKNAKQCGNKYGVEDFS